LQRFDTGGEKITATSNANNDYLLANFLGQPRHGPQPLGPFFLAENQGGGQT
jgi:hypothetical protein